MLCRFINKLRTVELDLSWYLAVVQFIIEMASALLALLIWIVVVALVVRPFGLRLPMWPFSYAKRRFALQSLNFSRYILVYGILHFGCGMLIGTTLFRYLEWKYWHSRPNFFTASEFFGYALMWTLLAGVLFGVMSWNERSGEKIPK